jgi:hypothetical protein
LGKLRDSQLEHQCTVHDFSYRKEEDEFRVKESPPVAMERGSDMLVDINHHSTREEKAEWMSARNCRLVGHR